MDEIVRIKTGENQICWMVVAKSKKYDLIRARVLIETQAEHLFRALQHTFADCLRLVTHK